MALTGTRNTRRKTKDENAPGAVPDGKIRLRIGKYGEAWGTDMAHILVIDDDEAIGRTLDLHLQQNGHRVSLSFDAEDGLRRLSVETIDIVILDIRLPGRDGLSLLPDIRRLWPALPVIMITAFHDLETTVSAIQGGAADYVPKPIDLDELDAAIARLLPQHDKQGGLMLSGSPEPARSRIIGQSPEIKEVCKKIAFVSQGNVTVLILGESGTGKGLVARAIHDASAERKQPFIAVNCAALVETLLESELFGHERGAFTGAVNAHKGKIEQAGSGTLLLDEIAELSPGMQGKLLHVLQDREYSPVGGTQPLKAATRFIAATNVNLWERVQKGMFREDLFYRLNVVSIELPPLRERTGDIPLLVDFLLRRINRDLHKNIRRVTKEAMDCLQNYAWPGNVRELENVLMKAAVLERGDALTHYRLPAELKCACGDSSHHPLLVAEALSSGERRQHAVFAEKSTENGTGGTGIIAPSFPQQPPGMPEEVSSAFPTLHDIEREHIVRALELTHWHKGKTCEMLGISRPKLERRIREFGLEPPKKHEDWKITPLYK